MRTIPPRHGCETITRQRRPSIALIAALILFALVYQWLYDNPFARKRSDSEASTLAKLETVVGITLPSGTRVLSQLEEGQPNSGDFSWILFSTTELVLPGSLERAGEIYAPRIDKTTELIESRIAPLKIEDPRTIQDFMWMHGRTNVLATTIRTGRGTFVLLYSVRQP